MAISETTLKDAMLMLIEQQNASGGLLGCELEAVVVDPASDWPLFAEKARELLTVNEVDVIFGNWTSVSRKSVLPVIEELNGLLFYPVQYEGEESSKNVFYTGAAPNQQAIPATDYFLEELGVEKFALLGTDYVYPRTTNNILESYLKDKGIAAEDIFVNYTPFGQSDWQPSLLTLLRWAKTANKSVSSQQSTATQTLGSTKSWQPQASLRMTSQLLHSLWVRKNCLAWTHLTLWVTWRLGITSNLQNLKPTQISLLLGRPLLAKSVSPTTRWKHILLALICG